MALPENALEEALEALLEATLAIPACRDEHQGARTAFAASGGSSTVTAASAANDTASSQPDWAKNFRHAQALREGALIAAHTIQSGDGGGASEGPNLKEKE